MIFVYSQTQGIVKDANIHMLLARGCVLGWEVGGGHNAVNRVANPLEIQIG